jgi:nicotinamidase-related amidase
MAEQNLESLIQENISINNNSALIVIDMINDGCRKGGVFETIGFDIAAFNNIEKNVAELANHFSKKGIEIIYVRTLYDFDYIPEPMIDKFKAFGLDKFEFSKKGMWGSQLIDTLPDVATAFVVKSNYSAFSEGFSALFDKKSLKENTDYFLSTSSLDSEFKKKGKLTIKDFYKQSLENEVMFMIKNEINFPISLHGYLKSKRIDTVVCVGGSTHVCLGATVYSAAERGYKIILPIDAIASEDSEKHTMFLQNFNMFNSTLTLTSTLI